MDIAAKDLDGLFLVLLQERRAGEADEHGLGQDGLHGLVQLAGLGAVTLIHKDKELALALEIAGQLALNIIDKAGGFLILILAQTKLMNQRAEQPRLGLSQPGHQINAAFGPAYFLIHANEDLFNLLIKLGTIGDDEHPGISDVLPYPLGQPDHGQALA